ncbi:MAG: sodium:calcium antiporter [Janthinobacterium lividum]
MFDHLSLPVLLAIFGGAAGIVWWAGIRLAHSTDILATRLGLGEALGGLIMLAIATNLPELAITATAAWRGNLSVAIGNILGGIALQTLVLVALDAIGMRGRDPLTYKAASLSMVLEGILVVAVLIVAIMASRLSPNLIVARLAPGDVLITLLWVAGIWLIGRASKTLPWHENGAAPDAQTAPKGHSKTQKANAGGRTTSTIRAGLMFAISAATTLVCGMILETSGNAIALNIGMTGVLFGATVLAAATSLPELSTGLASVKLGDYRLAISDIFGGNAFLPVLFLLATLISGHSALPQAQASDIYLAGLGVLLTCIYMYGLVFRPRIKILGMGIDSFVVLALYALGMGGLFAISAGHH